MRFASTEISDIKKKKSFRKENLNFSGIVTLEFPVYCFRKFLKGMTILIYFKCINSSFLP